MKRISFSNLFFTAQYSTTAGGYAHAFMFLYREGARQSFLTLKWQSDIENRAHWYSPHAEAYSTDGTGFNESEQFLASGKFLVAFPLIDDPVKFAAGVVDAGIQRRFWDGRVSQFLAPAEIKTSDYRRWMVESGGCCIADVLATDEADAKILAMKEMAQRIIDPQFHGMERSARELAEWIGMDKPVQMDTRACSPDMEPLATLWTPLGVPDEVATTA